ncbi:hypothetical protein H0H87_002130 [Tephrocybe sp. NHM501043]|nr:hypothetical protein H0H87_002130 [Tephrocybe sp. NHM501043]
MVLQSNFAKRVASNAENTPPSVLPKNLASRLLSTAHRRRARVNGHSTSSKYAAEQAARRSRKSKHPAHQLQFRVLAIPTPDPEMADSLPVASSSSSSNTVPVTLPKQLGRPDFLEVSREALMAVAPEFNDADAQYIRDALECFGVSSLKSLACVRPESVPAKLPSEIEVRLQPIDGFSPVNPTHMLAVFGPAQLPTTSPSPAQKRKVTLYPVHSAYLAAHCARLPPFASTDCAAENNTASGTPFKIPVRTLCLPSPATYPRLSSFLYTKNAEALIAGLMPTPPTSPLVSCSTTSDNSELRKNTTAFAYQLASTYTTQVLLQHAILVHGLWQNTCALGIFDEGLWEVIDTAWMVLLAAIAVGNCLGIDTVINDED